MLSRPYFLLPAFRLEALCEDERCLSPRSCLEAKDMASSLSLSSSSSLAVLLRLRLSLRPRLVTTREDLVERESSDWSEMSLPSSSSSLRSLAWSRMSPSPPGLFSFTTQTKFCQIENISYLLERCNFSS